MSKPAALLSKLTSVKMNKHLCVVNAFVFFLTCTLEANPSCVPLGKMLDIGALDPANLHQWIWSVVATKQTTVCVGWTQRSSGQNNVCYGQDSP